MISACSDAQIMPLSKVFEMSRSLTVREIFAVFSM